MQDEHPQTQSARQLSTTLARVLREFYKDYEKRITRGVQARGHPDIRASHQVVFSNIGLGRPRVTELAERAQVTQQAMGKTLKELENLGYVERAVDSEDRRAKTIKLTAKGLQLMDDALAVTASVNSYYAGIIGQPELDQLASQLRNAVSKLGLDYLPDGWAEPQGKQI
jgi:DNA-binding MarR family transcriptional regulator